MCVGICSFCVICFCMCVNICANLSVNVCGCAYVRMFRRECACIFECV